MALSCSLRQPNRECCRSSWAEPRPHLYAGWPYAGRMPRPTPTAADSAKSVLRNEVRARRRIRRDTQTRDERAAAAVALADAVVEWAASLARPLVFTAYESWPTEPPTEVLIAKLVAARHTVLVPLTHPLPDRTLDWCDAADPGRAPLGITAIAHADAVLVPGLVVDGHGTRLGQGGGYYAVALGYVRPSVPVIAVLWDEEVRGDQDAPLPRAPHDRSVSAVLTPGRGLTWLP